MPDRAPTTEPVPAHPRMSRRGFIVIAGLIAGAGALGAQVAGGVKRVTNGAAEKVRGLLPTFFANSGTFGRLIDQNGAVLPEQKAAATPQPEGRHRWVMVIDLARCDGCRLCTDACNEMHNVPPGQEWIRVFKMRDPRTQATYWFPKPCFQCDDSPCTKVCPVSATYKREDGVVLIDQNRCIGCRYCMAACPYSSRFFTWEEPNQNPLQLAQPYDVEMNTPHRKGVAEKCLFCPSLLRKGEIPACASHCAMGAIYAGDELEDMVTNGRGETVRFSKLIQDNGGYRYLEELGTNPRVWYLPPRAAAFGPAIPQTAAQSHP